MIEWILRDLSIPILTLALVFVTGYYAWQTRKTVEETKKLADETKRMAEETKKMAEMAEKSYAVSVAPEVNIIKISEGPAQEKELTKSIEIQNVGKFQFEWIKIIATIVDDKPTKKGGLMHQDVKAIVSPNKIRREVIYYERGEHAENIEIELKDISGRTHRISATKIQGQSNG